ncbi:MAG: RAMP superfamily CRISPR-associated protein [Acidobacteriota bacterium]|nr:RAMP superfamily CRISPR-associated protein [Acidobacteriota bacterium]
MATLTITLQGHLLVAGNQAADLGVDLATARRFDGQDWVPYIPGTALRGAIRIQLEALLRGARCGAVGPYPPAPGPGGSDPVARLFGYSGPLRQREGSHEGALRFGDAVPADRDAALAALTVRPGLEIDDHTGSASGGKLYFREIADPGIQPLVFTAPLEIRPGTLDADIELLRAAVATTDALGAGKSKGGGAIAISWSDAGSTRATTLRGDAAAAPRARLILTLAEPAHFGDGGPRGNHHATRTHIPGATVRGAIAWALLRSKTLSSESPEFRALFLDADAPVSFGDALLAAGPDATPAVQPATLRHRRGQPADLDDILVPELARDRLNRLLADRGVYLRADDGADRFEPAKTRPVQGLVRRTRTRVSIDRWNGASANGRLFSIEQIEPYLFRPGGGKPPSPVCFVSIVEGPGGSTPNPIRHLELLQGLSVLVGAGRNHGLGQVVVEVRFEPEPVEPSPRQSLLALGNEVDRLTTRFARRTGILTAAPPPSASHLVALVALSDYVPAGDTADHPLAEPALAPAGLAAVVPLRRFLNPATFGGYDQTPGKPPLKELLPAIGAGSVFVYELEPTQLPALETLLPVLRRGVGFHVESGCGRFKPFEPLQRTPQ